MHQVRTRSADRSSWLSPSQSPQNCPAQLPRSQPLSCLSYAWRPYLETHTGDITDGVAATTETCNEHLILHTYNTHSTDTQAGACSALTLTYTQHLHTPFHNSDN